MNFGSSFTADRPLVLVGAGKMGGAMLAGWLDNGLPTAAVRIIDPSPPDDSRAQLAAVGLAAETEPPAGLTAGAIVLAVKPQLVGTVLPALRSLVGSGTFVLSIAAGVTVATLETGLGAPAVRAMPNTPAQIGRGISAAVAGPGVDERQHDLATALLAAAGAVEWIADESLIDAVTAVSGSGPAYVFLLAELLAEAGTAAGLPADLAARLARATVSGAGALLDASELPPETLRRNVTSPGGTTAAALAVLMAEDGLGSDGLGSDGLGPLLRRAVAAAQQRSRELAG